MHKISKMACVAGVLTSAMTCGAALAGDGNQLNLLQSSPSGSLNGNTLKVDQSGADYSVVGGLTSDSIGGLAAGTLSRLNYDSTLATQLGEGNSATLNVEGYGARVQLLQASNPFASWAPGSAVGNNSAVINAGANTLGAVAQVGLSNTATLSLDDGADGIITQLGSDLYSDLNVEAGASGTVLQIGDNSSTGTVTVAPGTQLTYTQIGSNIAPVDATGLSIIASYSFGPITVTQTSP